LQRPSGSVEGKRPGGRRRRLLLLRNETGLVEFDDLLVLAHVLLCQFAFLVFSFGAIHHTTRGHIYAKLCDKFDVGS